MTATTKSLEASPHKTVEGGATFLRSTATLEEVTKMATKMVTKMKAKKM